MPVISAVRQEQEEVWAVSKDLSLKKKKQRKMTEM